MSVPVPNEPLWRPGAPCRLDAFRAEVARGQGIALDDYDALYDWSIREPAVFWQALWRFAEVRAMREADTVLQDGERMPGARWFVGARLNFAANLLRRRDDGVALAFYGEDQVRATWSWGRLYGTVSRLAQALRAQGVGPGDRVAGLVPNMPETVAAMLATASLGAMWSSCSPDFGVEGVLDRFGQIAPKVLFASDGYRYNGKAIDVRAKLAELAGALPGLERVVVWNYAGGTPELDGIAKVVTWDDFVAAYPAGEIDFAPMPFEAPLTILYSSGTTGQPKCIVHGAGGTLLQHLKEHMLHGDLADGDRLLYYTTCGWMMWNWMVSALAVGATLVLYDGAPLLNDAPDVLWRIAEATRLTHFGTSAKYLSALEKAGVAPGERYDLSSLRFVYSTGSPLLPASYDYVYRAIKPDVALCSISGGTDIVSCFALGCPAKPVYRGELQARGLGMAVEVWNEAGAPVVGEKGELVCTRPFPSMPLGFWNDADGTKYRAAYFERFPGVWVHGDWAELSTRGGLIIHGRSDTVLNPGGVRIGTAEIYRQVETVPEVLESLAIGQDWQGDVRVVLFVRLAAGLTLSDELQQTIRARIRRHTTPRHVPARIVQVADIPRTQSGKFVELAVREVVHGRPVKNLTALANPEALELFRNLAELAV
ncbi:acetoacetate--CoA ligase [Pseudogulbenkiania ferrooxidans]|uniref:Acetoacetyl-CoA synthase n=1 Tax=Pseudogulbenkiania ferrooxidans 2002 TaxID=279714 RepID=B9Z8Y2_9NEIS|nr:acetoacetate--CoA ligase [Pseudogulbenkiania ferrooxidans]EEG06801.1 acetoacetyl-CoA synthase [Pseudogulbenkiania ferrooxidans 2002]